MSTDRCPHCGRPYLDGMTLGSLADGDEPPGSLCARDELGEDLRCAPVRNGPSRYPSAFALALEFADRIRTDLTAEELAIVNEHNRTGHPSTCATHDFLDANQTMLDAMEQFGMELDPDLQEQADLLDAAWDIAKAAGFNSETIARNL